MGLIAGPSTGWAPGTLDIWIALGVFGAVLTLIGLAIYFIARP